MVDFRTYGRTNEGMVITVLWVLIYTSAIMMVLRFGLQVQLLKSLDLLVYLATSAVLAIAGLYLLSTASGLTDNFIFATLYGFGKTFFWPTTVRSCFRAMPERWCS